MNPIILASRSPARARLLADAGVTVALQPADIDEETTKTALLEDRCSPAEVAVSLAVAKALAIQAPGLVIGADQTLDLEGRLFDKPRDLAEARRQLQALRGREHRLHSAVALARNGAVVWQACDSVTLRVRPFSDAFLDRYLEVEGEALLGCVGAYRLEALGAQLFDRVEGDYFTVLGLPLLPLLAALRDQDVLQP